MTHLNLSASSKAEEAGYLALADIETLASRTGLEYRIVGGQMVSLHVALAGVPEPAFRQTLDADLGVGQLTAADPRLVEGLQELGYGTTGAANRFVRITDDDHQLVIDVLAPSFDNQMRSNMTHGELTLDEIPGLSLALAREGEHIDVTVQMTTGDYLHFSTVTPDPLSALCVKVMGWSSRRAAKDALDIWRMLRVFRARHREPPQWSGRGVQLDTERVLRADFVAPAGGGARSATTVRSEQAEIRALALSALTNAPNNDHKPQGSTV